MMPGAPADPHTTLVVYMGLSTLPTWSQQLQVGTLSIATRLHLLRPSSNPCGGKLAIYCQLTSTEILCRSNSFSSLKNSGRCTYRPFGDPAKAI